MSLCPEVLYYGTFFGFCFRQADLASTSFAKKKCTWVHFRSAPGRRRVYPGSLPQLQAFQLLGKVESPSCRSIKGTGGKCSIGVDT